MYIKHHSSDVTCHINAVPAGSPSHTWRWNPWFPMCHSAVLRADGHFGGDPISRHSIDP